MADVEVCILAAIKISGRGESGISLGSLLQDTWEVKGVLYSTSALVVQSHDDGFEHLTIFEVLDL